MPDPLPPMIPMTQTLGSMTQSLEGDGTKSQRAGKARRLPTVNQPERPLLARVADSVYWMCRYMERAEHVSRLMLVNSHLLMDLGDLAPALLDRQWHDVAKITHAPEVPPGADPISVRVARHCVFEPSNPSSLMNCIDRARENARGVRSDISAEMWESLNELYWNLRGGEAESLFQEQPEKFYDDVVRASMLFQGLTDQTLGRDQRWQFAQLGKYLERVDVTCRVMETRFSFLREFGHSLEGPIRNIVLMAALRMCCSIEAFRRQHFNELDLLSVTSFLVLEENHPRSVRFAVTQAHDAARLIRERTSGQNALVDAAERVLGRLAAQLGYAEPQELIDEGVPPYLQRLRKTSESAGVAVQQRYFLH